MDGNREKILWVEFHMGEKKSGRKFFVKRKGPKTFYAQGEKEFQACYLKKETKWQRDRILLKSERIGLWRRYNGTATVCPTTYQIIPFILHSTHCTHAHRFKKQLIAVKCAGVSFSPFDRRSKIPHCDQIELEVRVVAYKASGVFV